MLRPVLLAASAAACAAAAAAKPHIVFVLVDDLGWGNVGFHRAEPTREVQTPHMDALVAEGVFLDRHYVHYTCTPTRSSLQSGRFPVHVTTKLKNPEDPSCGVPRNMTGMAQKLQQAGYKTHQVGKWDAGMATPKHTPKGRGYDTSLGYFEHKNDFYTMKAMQTACKNTTDLWETDRPGKELVGTGYEEQIFGDRVVGIVQNHSVEDPLFLFYAPHVAHCPLQVPPEVLEKFAPMMNETDEVMCQAQTPYVNPEGSKYSCRAQYHAMVYFLDEVLGNLTAALKAKGMWDNTLLVLSSDNGGPPDLAESGANNWPLRGSKYSPWEGGIRAAAFASGGYLPTKVRGTRQEGIMHVADWYGTFAAMVGVDPADHEAAAAGLPAVDSVNVWPLLSGETTESPRKEFPVDDNTLVQGDWKLLLGHVGYASWGGPTYPNRTSHLSPLGKYSRQCGSDGCLYNLAADPHETTDVAASNPQVVAQMKQRLAELKKTYFENSDRGVDSCPKGTPGLCACWMAWNHYGGFMGPYQEIEL